MEGSRCLKRHVGVPSARLVPALARIPTQEQAIDFQWNSIALAGAAGPGRLALPNF
jgi:hypothetical protein